MTLFGDFSGLPEAEWIGDGRNMRLLQDFVYTDASGKQWSAPKGSVVDGASIPKVLWSFVGGPFEGIYRDASVVHDVACDKQTAPWGDVHVMFYWACRCGGVDELLAKILFSAVWHFGPRWSWPRPSVASNFQHEMTQSENFQHEMTQSDLDKMRHFVETQDPSLDRIMRFNPSKDGA